MLLLMPAMRKFDVAAAIRIYQPQPPSGTLHHYMMSNKFKEKNSLVKMKSTFGIKKGMTTHTCFDA